MHPLKAATIAAQLGHYVDPATGGLSPPLQSSTTFARRPDYSLVDERSLYGRDDQPIYKEVETVLAALEGGSEALVLPSGMAAIAALFRTLRPGEAVAVQRPIYYGAIVWLEKFCARRDILLHFFDGAEPAALERVVRQARPAIVWVETPSNPTLDVVDIARGAAIAHDAGAVLAIDSTAATPILSRPLEFGADVVMHSASKYLNGHSDVLAGALITRTPDDRWAAIKADRHDAGALLGPFEAWLLLRGMRTLPVRVQRACANALTIARFLEQHQRVERVLYPGLEAHPQHEVAVRQMTGGFGGLLSFQVEGGAEEALKVAGRLEVIQRATSLGGVESLIEHRFSIEGEGTGVPRNLLRLAVGIEDPDDLVADLAQALGAPRQ